MQCPIQCVRSACPDPDFIEKNGTWLLTAIAGVTGTLGVLLTYFLKSRCKKLQCCCIKVERDPVVITSDDLEADTSSDPRLPKL